METLQQIERSIEMLTPEQLGELYLWLEEKCQQLADARTSAELGDGRFDQVIDRALEDEAAGRITPL